MFTWSTNQTIKKKRALAFIAVSSLKNEEGTARPNILTNAHFAPIPKPPYRFHPSMQNILAISRHWIIITVYTTIIFLVRFQKERLF